MRIEKVHEMVKDAVIAGFENRQEIYENVIKFLREEVLSMTCEDVLATDVCSQLYSFMRVTGCLCSVIFCNSMHS